MPEQKTQAVCPICDALRTFTAPDDYWTCRDQLRAVDCSCNGCIPRQRAAADVLFSLHRRQTVPNLAIHESSPAPTGLSLWLRNNCPGYVTSGFFPEEPLGSVVRGLHNEDLERQTFEAERFDVVMHLDVMEHLFEPFQALREIYRTLKPGGYCLFTAPTYPERGGTDQVAFREPAGVRVVGRPEYHGNPQDENGALVTWRYGYDLPYLIAKETAFDVEVRRWYSPARAIMGPMTEVYILKKICPLRAGASKKSGDGADGRISHLPEQSHQMKIEEAKKLVAARRWYHKFEIFPGIETPGVYNPHGTLARLDLPDDMTGMTVLEIGPADGFFTRELAARGAIVTAMDYAPRGFFGFDIMAKLAGREFDFIEANIYDVDKQGFDAFDVVLCLGVLYHLPDPVRALWKLRPFVKQRLILEMMVSLKHMDEPVAEYLPAASRNGDYTNFWALNPRAAESILLDCGYMVERQDINGNRAMFHCSINKLPDADKKVRVAYSFLER